MEKSSHIYFNKTREVIVGFISQFRICYWIWHFFLIWLFLICSYFSSPHMWVYNNNKSCFILESRLMFANAWLSKELYICYWMIWSQMVDLVQWKSKCQSPFPPVGILYFSHRKRFLTLLEPQKYNQNVTVYLISNCKIWKC